MDNVETNIAKSIDKRDSANASTRNRKRRKKNGNKKPFILIAAVLVIVILGIVLIVGALDKDDKKEPVDNKVEQQDENSNEAVNGDVDEDIEEWNKETALEEKGFKIETPYVELNYPEYWKKQVRVEQVEDSVYTVQFYGILEGKEEQHMFDIVFGGDEGTPIGYVESNGEEIVVNVVSYSLNLDESWSEEETTTLYTMQEDINYIIWSLEESKDFKKM